MEGNGSTKWRVGGVGASPVLPHAKFAESVKERHREHIKKRVQGGAGGGGCGDQGTADGRRRHGVAACAGEGIVKSEKIKVKSEKMRGAGGR